MGKSTLTAVMVGLSTLGAAYGESLPSWERDRSLRRER